MENIDTTIADLEAVVSGIETDGLPARFISGHGLQSRRFRFDWADDKLALRFDLPCCRVLSGDEQWRADEAEIAAACRMGLLLLAAHADGKLLHDTEGEAMLAATCDDSGARYEIRDAEGETLDAGDGWTVLAARLEGTFAPAAGAAEEAVSIILP